MLADRRDKKCRHCARLLWTQIQQSRPCGMELSAKVRSHQTELRRLNSQEKPDARSIALEGITMLVLFSLERNSTCDPETLQSRHFCATLDMSSVDTDRPRPWHLTLGPECALVSVLTFYDLYLPSTLFNRKQS